MLQTTSKDKALSLLSKRGVHHAPLFSLTIALYLQYLVKEIFKILNISLTNMFPIAKKRQ